MPNAQLHLKHTIFPVQLYAGLDHVNRFAYVQASETGVGYRNLILQADGGNLGIGTSSPASKLDVLGTISVSGTGALVRKDYGYSSSYKFIQVGAPNNANATVALAVDVSGVAGGQFSGQNQIVLPNNGALFVNAAGNNFIGGIARDSSNRILLGPSTSGGITSGDLIIDTSGNVGIGTSSPSVKLDVNGNAQLRANGAFLFLNSDNTNYYYLQNNGVTGSANAVLDFVQSGVGTRMRIDSTGKVGIGTTAPTHGLHVTSTTSLDAVRNIFVPHSGVIGGYGATSTNKIHIGSYLDLQHFSFTNVPAILFNASIKRSDFIGSGTGTGSNFNVIEPYHNLGHYTIISNVNGGISFNIGLWGGLNEVDLGSLESHASYKGGHDGNCFVIRSTGANGLNMRPDTGDSNNSARVFFVNSATAWAIMNNSSNLSFRSGATVGSDSGTQRMYIDTSGNVVIGGVLTETSSITLKENVNPITNALDYISQLVGVTYDRKDGSAKNRAGLIREEVEKVLPNVVNDNGIQYTNIIAYLVESIKDLKKEIENLKKGN
jgi:hypothetical protein